MESKITKPATVLASVLALVLAACSQQGQDTGQPSAPGTNSPMQSPAAANSGPASFSSYMGSFPTVYDNKQCSIDSINGQAAENTVPVATSSTVIFGGWAGDGKGNAANGFQLVLKGEQSFAAPIQTTVARADVAKAWGSGGMANSGFNLSASLAGVVAGDYAVYIADPANPSNVCNAHRTVTVR